MMKKLILWVIVGLSVLLSTVSYAVTKTGGSKQTNTVTTQPTKINTSAKAVKLTPKQEALDYPMKQAKE